MATAAATGTANANANASQPDAADPKTYYGYLFGPDKTPTKVLDALLRAIAQHVVRPAGASLLLESRDLA